MTQIQAILNHLQSNVGITSKEAFEQYGCTRLSDKIFNLRKQGYSIINVNRQCIDRFGHNANFVEYRLIKE